MPVTEYHLAGMSRSNQGCGEGCVRYFADEGDASRGSGAAANVAFVCTPTLGADLQALAQRWMLGQAEAQHDHESSKPSGSHDIKDKLLRPELQEYIEGVYAADVALYAEHCGGA